MLCNIVFWKVFKNSIKTINESISCNAANFLYSRSTQRKIGHSKRTARALEGHLGTRAFVGHLGTRALKVFGILDTRAFAALEHLKDTRALIALEEMEPPHLANSHKNSFSTEHCSLLKHFYENRVLSKIFLQFYDLCCKLLVFCGALPRVFLEGFTHFQALCTSIKF